MRQISVVALVMLASLSLSAAQYCTQAIKGSNHNHVAYITCQSSGGNQYEFVFVSADPINSYNIGSNFYANVNGAGGYHVSEHFEKSGDTLRCVMTSTSVPNFYVADFFVMYTDGEEWYKIPTDADFSQTCADVEPQQPDTTGGKVDPQVPDTTGSEIEDPGEPIVGERTEGSCSGAGTEVDGFYTSADPNHAVASLSKGYKWTVETTPLGVKISMQFLDKLNGMAAPYLFRFGSDGILMGDPLMMNWDASTLTANYMLTDLYDGDTLTFLVQVALAEGGILFSGRVSYTVGADCDGEVVDVAVENVAKMESAQKIIRNGHIVIIRNGIEYDVLGRN